ncbi:hypothetical protein V5N11_009002 [Cardamine amara subsp. amara]|uniref:Retrotransposon gag domain-containing protein n=1 Tax=Cardamine amara subsp. amara TaxID=228776 RepID=A0ABD1C772_CARAN
MTSRTTRRNRTETLINPTNEELARLERQNRQKRLQATPVIMAEQDNGMAAQLQLLRYQIAQLRREQPQAPLVQPGIGDSDNPHAFYQNRSAIVSPTIQRQDFEIKPQMISLVKQHLFHGLPAEIPMDHIKNFEEICSTTGSNGVPSEFLKCKLFPFSLADKAQRWLKSLPAGSLRMWDEVRAAFLDHFYTKSKTAALRNKISSFQQHSGEAFCEAWERLKEYRRECPHHGFKDEQILGIFYDGVEWDYRNALNAASNGDFMTKTKDGAFELIENLASSSKNKSPEYDRSRKVNSVDTQKIDELTAKVNLLLRGNQKSVHLVDEDGSAPISQDFEDDDACIQEVNYVSGQGYVQNRGFNPNYRNHPNLSYRSTNVENPQDQVYPQQGGINQLPQAQGFQKFYSSNTQGKQYVPNQNQNRFQGGNQQQNTRFAAPQQAVSAPTSRDELKSLMQQLMVNQQKASTEINAKVDYMYNDLNAKYEAVTAHVKKLDTQVAQTAEAIKRPAGALPGKGELPRNEYHVNAVELRSGRLLVPPTMTSSHEKAKEKVTECQAREDDFAEKDGDVEIGSSSGTPMGTVPTESEEKSSEHPNYAPEHLLQQGAPAKIQKDFPERVYVPKVPYPVPPKKTRKDLEDAKCREMLKDLTVKLPLVDAVQMIPSLKRYMKELVAGKVVEEENVMIVSKECSAILQSKVLTKKGDPGRFVITVKIGPCTFACSLCDLGSSVNLMPYSVAKRLGFTKFKPTKISLVFADRSTKLPVGIIEDLHFRIGDTLIPADFVVLELDEEPKDPLILGRAFLCTARAYYRCRRRHCGSPSWRYVSSV